MKIRNVFAIAGFAFMMMIGFTACEEDLCKDVVCENGGTCLDGDCICAAGYEGSDCSTIMADKFVGTYDVVETCDGNTFNFVCAVSKSTAEITRINFDNFFDFNSLGISSDVYGTINGTDITLPAQTVTGGGYSADVSGSGSITETSGVLNLTYTVSDGTYTNNCAATYTRQ